LNKTDVRQVKSFELIDNEKIVLNAKGIFPRRVIMMESGIPCNEYRLCKTKSGSLILNK